MKKSTLLSIAMLAAACITSVPSFALEQDADGYYLIGSKADLQEWTTISGYEATNAKLTADIDNVDFMLCTNSASFEGIFDGQGHTMTLNIDTNKEHGGLFYNMKGTVRNLIVGGTFVARSKNCGIVAGYSWSANTKFENVVSIAEMQVDWTGNPSNSGFLGITKYNCTFTGCVSAVKFTGNQGYNQGFVGWMSGGLATIKNCISIAEATGTAANASYSWGNTANEAKFSISNSYSVATAADGSSTLSNATYTTAADIASGKVAYDINQTAGTTVFYQNLGENADAYPVPFDTHAKVYANGQANCDGSPKEGSQITYSNTDALVQDDHVDVDGFCGVCGNVVTDHIAAVDGVYPLASAEDVVWFSAMVNVAGRNEIQARLTADIDFTGIEYLPIGNTYDTCFNGTFDGQGHKISNLVVETNVTTPIGFFGVVGNKAIIKNLYLDETCSFQGAGFVAGIAASGKKTDGTAFQILNCVNAATIVSTNEKASGFFAQDPAAKNAQAAFVMDNCVNAGNVTAPGNGKIASSFCGWVNTNPICYIYNSYNIGEITNAQTNNVMFYGANRFMNNCYDLNHGTDASQQGFYAWSTTAPATSGELAAQMGCNFYQNTTTDAYPVPFYAEGRSLWNKITTAGYSTFYAKEATVIPAGVTAYTAKVNGNYLTLTAIEGTIIPAKTPVILKGAEGIYEMKVTADDASAIADNDLQASEETTNPDGTHYVLGFENAEVGFYQAAIGLSGKWNYMITPGKAYLVVTEGAGVKGFTFTNDATGIEMVNGQSSMVNGSIYNIAGQRLNKIQKGINIMNGKKILK